jgi:hypothetical protein
MAPEIMITAEALVAGLVERKIVDEKDDAGHKCPRARRRPE